MDEKVWQSPEMRTLSTLNPLEQLPLFLSDTSVHHLHANSATQFDHSVVLSTAGLQFHYVYCLKTDCCERTYLFSMHFVHHFEADRAVLVAHVLLLCLLRHVRFRCRYTSQTCTNATAISCPMSLGDEAKHHSPMPTHPSVSLSCVSKTMLISAPMHKFSRLVLRHVYHRTC